MRRAFRGLVWAAVLCVSWSIGSCARGEAQSASQAADTRGSAVKVTFIELGSVDCIPCKAMQPIMETVRQKYGSQVKVVFHDVWTDVGQPYAKQFGIRVIPTQVFLDKNGKEFFRHEGFFPADQLFLILEKGGVKL